VISWNEFYLAPVLKRVLAHFINATNIYLEIFLGFSYVLLEHIFFSFLEDGPIVFEKVLESTFD
jgi:hypothetical protein